MSKFPVQLSALLHELTSQLPAVLGRNLIGIYLYGSVTHGAFNPRRSDVDCLVVTQRDLSDAQFRKVDAWLTQTGKSNPWTARLQMMFLVRKELLIINGSGCLYQFGVLTRTGSDGNPIVWMDVLKSGKVLFGPRPETFLPEITWELFSQALERELGYLREEISRKPKSEWRELPLYRTYAVLTVCRILVSLKEGGVVSKPHAAKWALKSLPSKWHRIIRQALKFNETSRESDIPLDRIDKFIEFAHAELRAALDPPHR